MSKADVVVVGGGIVGWATAWNLKQEAPSAAVVVVEDDRIGKATAAGAGIATPFTLADRGPVWTRLMFEAMSSYESLMPQLDGEGGYDVVGELLVASDDEQAAALPPALTRLEANIAHYGSIGIGRPRLIEADEVRRLHPLLAPASAAIHIPLVAQVDGRVLADRLATSARRLGVREQRGRAELVAAAGAVRSVRLDGEAIDTGAVVVAAGAWTEELLSPLGLSAGVYPQRGQIVHARIAGHDRLPLVTGFGSTYLLCFEGGRLVFGPTREDDSGFEEWPTIGGLMEMLDRSQEMAPGLAGARWIEIRSGLRPMTRDGLPTVGTYDSIDGLVLATGLGAQGLTIGPHIGSIAARLALGQPAALDAALSPQRWLD